MGEGKKAYLFKEVGGRLTDWFVFTGGRGLADGGLHNVPTTRLEP